MAINRDLISLGDRNNRKQAEVKIPAKAAADKPGILVLDAVADNATVTPYYYWTDSNGVLRSHTSVPTNQDSDGSAVGTAGGANVTLSNLTTVACNTTIASDAANTDDLGTTGASWRSLYLGTGIYFKGTTRYLELTASEPAGSSRVVNFPDPGGADSMVYLAATQDITGKTYNGLTVVAGSNAVALTQGTGNMTVAAAGSLDLAAGAALDVGAAGNVDFGTGTYNFVGNIDIATGKTVNIDNNMTIQGDLTISGTTLADQDLRTAASPTFVGLTLTGAIATPTTITASGLVTAAGGFSVNADNINIVIGASGATDSRIYFDGDDLVLWDSKVGGYTLQQLATGTTLSPSVVGDFTILDGKLTWTDAADEAAGVWTFANTTAIDIAVISAITTGSSLSITADSCANGKLFVLDADGGVGSTGHYLYALDGTNPMFTVGNAGAIGIYGPITAASTADIVHKISRNNATGTGPILEIEETNAAGGVALLVDSDHTGAADAAQITYAGTDSGLNITIVNTAGTALTAVTATLGADKLVYLDGTTSDGWVGAAGTGMLHLAGDGALAHAGASLLYSTYTGAIAAIVSLGTCGQFIDAGSAAATTAYAVGIQSTNNSGLYISTAAVDEKALNLSGPAAQTASMAVLDGTTGTGWIGAATTGMLHLSSDGEMADDGASLVYATYTGNGGGHDYSGTCARFVDAGPASGSSYTVDIRTTNNHGLQISTGAGGYALALSGAATQTNPILAIWAVDGAGWAGAENVGILNIGADDAMSHVAASMVYLGSSAAIDDSRGHCLRIVDSSSVAGTMGYPVYVTSNDATEGGILVTTHASGNAIAVSAGQTNLDGALLIGGVPFVDGTPDTVTGASLASSLTTAVTYIDSTAGAIVPTLANGAQGQMKFVQMTVDNGDATFTPANPEGFTTVKFTAIGQTALFIFLNSKWHLVGTYGTTVA